MCYLFSFSKFAGHDRVFYTHLNVGKAGDLIQCGSDFLLNLGNEISFPELIKTQFTPNSSRDITHSGFFDTKYLELLHWMVYQRYSTYNNVLKAFVSFEISQLLSRESRSKSQTKKLNWENSSLDLNESKQNLIIIPDNRSRDNQLSNFFSQEGIINLFSLDTQNRKDQHRREIKKSKVGIIVATQSEIFQPFNNLGTIVLIDNYKRYYHNQQDPRYDVNEVVKKLQGIWGCEVVNINDKQLIK